MEGPISGKGGKGGKGGSDWKRRAEAETSPPRPTPVAATGLEQAFLQACQNAGKALVVRLRDGSTIRGVIESHDRDTIEIRPPEGSPLFIRKTDVVYIEE